MAVEAEPKDEGDTVVTLRVPRKERHQERGSRDGGGNGMKI